MVFTSDHGDFLGDHGLLRKRGVGSDALLHVPLLMRAPGCELPPTVETPLTNCDLMATLTSMTGTCGPKWQHGLNITRVSNEDQRYVYAFCAGGTPRTVNYTVYDERYRMTYWPAWDFTELYDHQVDPGESKNIAAQPEQEKQAVRLRASLEHDLPQFYSPIVGRVCRVTTYRRRRSF